MSMGLQHHGLNMPAPAMFENNFAVNITDMASSIEHGGIRTFFHMVVQYFGNDLLEPFESKFIGSTGLAMTYLWLSWPSLMRGYQDTFSP